MAENIQAMRCPSCGGPIQFAPGESLATCHFCGTQVSRDVELPLAEKPPIVFDLGRLTAQAQLDQQKRNRSAVALTIVVVILTLGFTAFMIALASSEGGAHSVSIGQSRPADEVSGITGAQLISDSGPQILVTARTMDSNYWYFYLDFSAATPLRWRSGPLPDDYYQAVTVFDENAVYVLQGTELYALGCADGKELWRANLSDQLTPGCESCFAKIGDQVVVLPQDGVLAAYNAATGTKSWGARLEEPTRVLFTLDGKPAVWDKADTGAVVRIFDLATGQESQRIAPSGPNQPFPNDPQTPNVFSPFLVGNDGNTFITMFGIFEPFSIQRWDAQSGQMLWQATAPDDFSNTDSSGAQLLSGGYLVISAYGNLLVLDEASGAQKMLIQTKDYNLTPILVHEGTLLVSAGRQRGSSRDELWAYDLRTGERAWTIVPEAQNWMDNDFGFVDTEGEWLVHPAAGGVFLVQFSNDPIGMTYQRIDVTSGTGSAQKTILPPGDEPQTAPIYLNPFFWQGENIWYPSDKMYFVELSSGQTTVKWP